MTSHDADHTTIGVACIAIHDARSQHRHSRQRQPTTTTTTLLGWDTHSETLRRGCPVAWRQTQKPTHADEAQIGWCPGGSHKAWSWQIVTVTCLAGVWLGTSSGAALPVAQQARPCKGSDRQCPHIDRLCSSRVQPTCMLFWERIRSVSYMYLRRFQFMLDGQRPTGVRDGGGGSGGGGVGRRW